MGMFEYYHAYSIIAVMLCPFKTWNLIIACYLKYKCSHMKEADFDFYMKKDRFIVINEPNELNKNLLD